MIDNKPSGQSSSPYMSDFAPANSPQSSTNDSYHTVFLSHPEPAWLVDPERFTILEANARALEAGGYSASELEGRPLTEMVQGWDPAKFIKAIQDGDFQSPELRGVTSFTHGGKAIEVDLVIGHGMRGGKDVLIVVLADAAPRLRLEEQLRQAQKMETIGMLAGGIAHDFNNLLTIISGYSHMLAAGLAGDERNQSAAEQIIKASDRAAALTSQLLAFSRRQVTQVKTLDLNALVKGMAPMLRRLIGEHINLRIVAGPELGGVHADAGQVEQVIMNLVVNARDAMAEGGKLIIETQNAELDGAFLSKHMEVRPGPYVMLSVTDTGIGMDAATREKVFEPFFTTKVQGQGTGLGLSMVYGIVKRGGGAVNVYSEPGHGTTVKVFFPRAASVAAVAAPAALIEPAGGWETVLLVEDEAELRELVRASLEERGYRVLVAAGGEEAIRISREHANPVHLLITDIVMPEMSGADVARRVRRQRPSMQVLYMSGYTDVALHHTEGTGPTMHFISKPFTPSALARKVREIIDEKKEGSRQKRKASS